MAEGTEIESSKIGVRRDNLEITRNGSVKPVSYMSAASAGRFRCGKFRTGISQLPFYPRPVSMLKTLILVSLLVVSSFADDAETVTEAISSLPDDQAELETVTEPLAVSVEENVTVTEAPPWYVIYRVKIVDFYVYQCFDSSPEHNGPTRRQIATVPSLPFSDVVIVNEKYLFVSGMIGLKPGTAQIIEGGVQAEALQSLRDMAVALEYATLKKREIFPVRH